MHRSAPTDIPKPRTPGVEFPLGMPGSFPPTTTATPLPPEDPESILSGGYACPNLFFIDLETTSLNPRAKILEIAIVVTDTTLREIAYFHRVIHHNVAKLELSSWCKRNFSDAFLKEVADSKHTMASVKTEVAMFLDAHRHGKKIELAGSSVAFDRRILQHSMPDVVKPRLHYRVVDISSIAALVRRWYPNLHRFVPHKPQFHRALPDARASASLLRYYRDHCFRPVWFVPQYIF